MPGLWAALEIEGGWVQVKHLGYSNSLAFVIYTLGIIKGLYRGILYEFHFITLLEATKAKGLTFHPHNELVFRPDLVLRF